MKQITTLFIIMVAAISMWAQPVERDDMRFDFDRQLEQADFQRPDLQVPIANSETTPAGGMQQQHQTPDKILRSVSHAPSRAQETVNFLGYVNQNKFRFAIFDFVDRGNIVATLTGWVDSYDYVPHIVVPDNVTFDGQQVPVTTIADQAFFGGWGITGLTLGKNVECIGEHAFYNCSFTEVSIPYSVNLIMNGAFLQSKLQSVVFENAGAHVNPLVIGPQAFAYTYIKSIEIPARLRVVDEDDLSFRKTRSNPFQGCDMLETITINPKYHERDSKRNYTLEINQGALCERVESDETYPEYVYVIAYPAAKIQEGISLTEPFIGVFTGAFEDSKINSITLCSTSVPLTVEGEEKVVMGISSRSFAYSQISTLNISANGRISLISDFALGCRNLSAYIFSESITNLKVFDGVLYGKRDGERYLVSYPSGRTDVSFSIPEDVLHLEKYSFFSNWNIKEVSLPNGLKSIGTQVFCDCANLERLIYNGNSLETIGADAFAYTKIVSSAPQGEVTLGNWLIGYNGDVPTNLVIPENINHAADAIFMLNENITSVTFPSDFEVISNNMFRGCTNLRQVQLPANLRVIGVAAFSYIRPSEPLQTSPQTRTTNTLFAIPEGVEDIGAYAFEYTNISDKLILPSTIVNVAAYAFNTYNQIGEIEIHRSTPPDDSTSSYIFNSDTYKFGTLIIPKDAEPLAFSQSNWWNFKNIINGDFASIEEVEIEPGKINVSSGAISTTNGENFMLYATDGRVIGNGNSFSGLNPGIYIVRLGSAVQKYVIR